MCERVDLGNGNFAMVCGGHRRVAKCEFCRARPHTRLCDMEMLDGKTCDARMCDSCATPGAGDLDHCPTHSGKQVAAVKSPPRFPASAQQLKNDGWRPQYSRSCKLCHNALEFWITPAGRLHPLEQVMEGNAWMLVSHFTTCPFADKFRKPVAPAAAPAEKQAQLFGGAA